jgi:TolA-binding protein
MLIIFFLFYISSSAKIQKVNIVFYIGDVSIYESSSKKTIKAKAGMILTPQNILKTGKNSLAQVQNGTHRYSINEKSSLSIADILKLDPDKGTNGLFLVFGKSRANGKTIAAGVRAADRKENISWAENEQSENQDATIDLLDAIKSFISSDQYEKAISIYEKNKHHRGKYSIKCKYLAAASYLYICQYHEAGILFDAVAQSSDSEIAPEALYHSALCAYGFLDYNKTISILNLYIKTHPEGKYIAQAYYIMGKCNVVLKNNSAASNFKIVMDKYSTDPIAESAEEEYNKIKK